MDNMYSASSDNNVLHKLERHMVSLGPIGIIQLMGEVSGGGDSNGGVDYAKSAMQKITEMNKAAGSKDPDQISSIQLLAEVVKMIGACDMLMASLDELEWDEE